MPRPVGSPAPVSARRPRPSRSAAMKLSVSAQGVAPTASAAAAAARRTPCAPAPPHPARSPTAGPRGARRPPGSRVRAPSVRRTQGHAAHMRSTCTHVGTPHVCAHVRRTHAPRTLRGPRACGGKRGPAAETQAGTKGAAGRRRRPAPHRRGQQLLGGRAQALRRQRGQALVRGDARRGQAQQARAHRLVAAPLVRRDQPPQLALHRQPPARAQPYENLGALAAARAHLHIRQPLLQAPAHGALGEPRELLGQLGQAQRGRPAAALGRARLAPAQLARHERGHAPVAELPGAALPRQPGRPCDPDAPRAALAGAMSGLRARRSRGARRRPGHPAAAAASALAGSMPACTAPHAAAQFPPRTTTGRKAFAEGDASATPA